MNYLKLNVLWIFALMISISACTDDASDDTPAIVDGIIEFDASNLPDNGDDFTYYMWLESGGVTFNLGSFDVVGNLPSQTQWQLGDLSTVENASRILVSLSPTGVTPTTPSETVMLEAQFGTNGAHSGNITTGPMSTDQSDFFVSTGEYFLATPTTSTMSEERSGIWFGNNTTGSVTSSLVLPTLTDGWVYQGWVNLGTEGLLRTGKFYNPEFADLETLYSGGQAGYDVPGEDFNQNLPNMANPPVLSGNEVWVTVQPDTFTDKLFALPIFKDTIGVAEATTYTLPNVFPNFSGTVSRR